MATVFWGMESVFGGFSSLITKKVYPQMMRQEAEISLISTTTRNVQNVTGWWLIGLTMLVPFFRNFLNLLLATTRGSYR